MKKPPAAKFKLGDTLLVKHNGNSRLGRVVEVTLFRHENSIGYGITDRGEIFFVGQNSVKEKVA